MGRLGRVLLFAVSAGACGIFSADENRVVGEIAPDFPIEVPDTVLSSVPFSVAVWTVGAWCSRADDTEYTVEGNIARITPYDVHRDVEICPAAENFYKHQVWIEFDTPGEAQVRFNVRDQSGELIEIDRAVWVT